ncbi:hypothetical protein TNIN_201581 [Trichonephila inaurata madagascariensis]|uniref:Uncharacterized protein n=1 Tax=Trichonephila inaurata madagascariensis TaxID=2747483 RepID=A0A8X6XXM6_9ARAC|nr:hypothetical protein TNIN_201581 [Trichonephila inaurata madagascariensis]
MRLLVGRITTPFYEKKTPTVREKNVCNEINIPYLLYRSAWIRTLSDPFFFFLTLVIASPSHSSPNDHSNQLIKFLSPHPNDRFSLMRPSIRIKSIPNRDAVEHPARIPGTGVRGGWRAGGKEQNRARGRSVLFGEGHGKRARSPAPAAGATFAVRVK